MNSLGRLEHLIEKTVPPFMISLTRPSKPEDIAKGKAGKIALKHLY
ncbi:MAG: hypothetical protein R2880_16150 [Deinococcales bacterium]